MKLLHPVPRLCPETIMSRLLRFLFNLGSWGRRPGLDPGPRFWIPAFYLKVHARHAGADGSLVPRMRPARVTHPCLPVVTNPSRHG
jgi:hypothetical protein